MTETREQDLLINLPEAKIASFEPQTEVNAVKLKLQEEETERASCWARWC